MLATIEGFCDLLPWRRGTKIPLAERSWRGELQGREIAAQLQRGIL